MTAASAASVRRNEFFRISGCAPACNPTADIDQGSCRKLCHTFDVGITVQTFGSTLATIAAVLDSAHPRGRGPAQATMLAATD